MPFLLVDFGTTSTKSALVDLDSGAFSHILRHPAIPNCAAPSSHYEISLDAIRARFLDICTHYYDHLKVHFAGIAICSEMHGFAILDHNKKPLTNYISWKDERSLQEIEGNSTYSRITSHLGPKFQTITGMRPRPGFPLLNLTHLARTSPLPPTSRVVSLPGWLALCSDDSCDLVHSTILAGMGFYDIRRRRIAPELVDLVADLSGYKCRLNNLAPATASAGYWHKNGHKIPLYVGVGDHQCSVLGACNTAASLSINVSTESQIALIDRWIDREEIEIRPYFNDSFLSTITHIPAGRVLSEFIIFLEEVAQKTANEKTDFWSMLAALEEEEILNSTLEFDLSIFPGARNFAGGGKISRIREGEITLKNFLGSLLKSFAHQYLELLEIFNSERHISACILSGGIARNLPALHHLIGHFSGLQTKTATRIDESLLGLRTLAFLAAGRADNYLEAQNLFGRKCHLESG